MKIFNFKIEDRQIEALGDVITAGDANVDQFAFTFDSEWDGLTKTVVFINGTQPILANLIDDVAQLPTQVYQTGILTFGVYGRNENDQVVLSSLMYSFEVYEGAYDLSGNPQNLPDKTTWDEYTDIMLGLVAQGQLTLADCRAILGQVTDLKNTTKGYMDTTEGYKDTTKGYMDTTEEYKATTKQYMDTTEGYKNDVNTTVTNFNNNVVQKTNAFNQNATDKTNAFNSNATDKTNTFNQNATDKTTAFNNNATDKTGTFNSNATDKTTAFNNNATQKTADFDENAASYAERLTLIESNYDLGTSVVSNGTITDALNGDNQRIAVCGNTTQDGTPTQDSPVPMIDVTGTQTIKITAHNLKQDASLISGYINTSTSTYVTYGTSGSNAKSYSVPCQPNTTYYIKKGTSGNKFKVADCVRSPSNAFAVNLLFDDDSKDECIVTTTPIATYLIIYVSTTPVTELEVPIDIITPANPIQNYTIRLGDIHLKGFIGTNNVLYKDEICKNKYDDKWYLVRRIGEVVLNGTENWNYGSPTMRSNIVDSLASADDTKALSNYFPLYVSTSASNYRLRINSQHLNTTDPDTFKAWLSTHNATLEYILKYANMTEITDETLLNDLEEIDKAKTYKGATVIQVTPASGNPAQLQVTYYKDNLADELAALEARVALLE